MSEFWKNTELFPLFQQIVSLQNRNEKLGYEAMIRGRKNGKNVPPSMLFEMAEKDSLQAPLDYAARHFATREARQLISDDKLLFLNCHGHSLEAGLIFEDPDKLEFPLSQIVLEITEQTKLSNFKEVSLILSDLRKLGMKVALDDFGSGYSNFWYIESLQPEFIKLNRTLIQPIVNSQNARKVIEGMMAFVSKLPSKPQLIAEGIETEEQLQCLVEMGILLGQGFLFGFPFQVTKRAAEWA